MQPNRLRVGNVAANDALDLLALPVDKSLVVAEPQTDGSLRYRLLETLREYGRLRLPLVTIFQFVEDLSDRQAADAVRARIDWKYALGLELENPGFDHTVLSEFRGRLVQSGAERLLLYM